MYDVCTHIYIYVNIYIYIYVCASTLYLFNMFLWYNIYFRQVRICIYIYTYRHMYIYIYIYDMDVYIHMNVLRIDCIGTVSTAQLHVYGSKWWCPVILTIHRDLSDLHHAPSCTKPSIFCIWQPSCPWARANLAQTREQKFWKKGPAIGKNPSCL